MKFNNSILPYLRGEKFSNGLEIPIPYHQVIPERVDLLTELSEKKKVIHLGCLDHLPLIDEKISKGTWLHKRITDIATKCIGVDINKEAKDYVSKNHGFNNILINDITRDVIPQILNEQWDYAILGELLEHTDNPVQFLSDIREKYQNNISAIIVTIPNVLTKQIASRAHRSVEIVNTDHRYWFSPYTIAKVMHHAGIEITDIQFANCIQLTTFELIKRKLLRLIGSDLKHGFDYASTIVAIGSLRGKTNNL